ncbi:uncharacterized protein LOC116346041 [Contarinia nasturtii]|uniref:uncharacterized protein LOC116346041 n=1 Tax=Contarinia nasturtii TaxID=265458 RepID=UPI0012D407CD|nr:uncharacterized protein LOC116346041 [Contarinia nasturtii]
MMLLLLFFATQSLVFALDYKKPVEFACVHDQSQTKFNNFAIGLKTATKKAIDGMVGNRKRINLHFLGYENELQNSSVSNFQAAKEFMKSSNVAVCLVQYAYRSGDHLDDPNWYQNLIKERSSFVADVALDFIVTINRIKKVSLDNVFLSGFCLGCNVAAMVGEKVKDRFFGKPISKVGVLTAIDPPRAGFSERGANRVNKLNAAFVIGIHTSTQSYTESFGHVDIYVNDREQFSPGCKDQSACSHLVGHDLYKFIVAKSKALPSINGNPVAFKDPKCAKKVCKEGDHFVISLTDIVTDTKKYGDYFLNTGDIFEKPSEELIGIH